MFYHMQNCITSTITALYDDGKTCFIPPIQMGSYSQPATTALAALFMILMAIQLFDWLQDVMGDEETATVVRHL
jgi:hypothetical protein